MPQQLIQKNGAKVWGGEFRAFGELTAETGSWENRLRFPGQYYDQESNNYYNYFRDYDPATGRYIQSDPIGLKGGLNTYAYVNGDPINFIDPDGQRLKPPRGVGRGKGKGKGRKSSPSRPCSVYTIVDCHGEIVYIGSTFKDRIRQREQEHKRRDVIKKYSCSQCRLKFVGPIKTFSGKSGLFGCEVAEKAMIVLFRPIFNNDWNPDSNRARKVKKWQDENCQCIN
jgi:RHS repeat-associated protein